MTELTLLLARLYFFGKGGGGGGGGGRGPPPAPPSLYNGPLTIVMIMSLINYFDCLSI